MTDNDLVASEKIEGGATCNLCQKLLEAVFRCANEALMSFQTT